MNDERIGVLIVGADEKVHQELSPVLLVELGDDVLQPPRCALKEERQRIEVEEEQGAPLSASRVLYRMWPPSCRQRWATRTRPPARPTTAALPSPRLSLSKTKVNILIIALVRFKLADATDFG